MRFDDATQAQVDAADPSRSTWLSANAGSGKTRVLTDRVARMLLDGVDPASILCLTYTKAAASEMQNRLFRRLGSWAMKPDVDLRAELAELGVSDTVEPEKLARARQLFARAIETPGGLRIQTIHSFCASLLRRFPLEAGVTPQFTEMDDRASALLRERILDEMADTRAPQVMADLAGAYTSEDFADLAQNVAGRRGEFTRFLTEADARDLFGVSQGQTVQSLLAEIFLGGEEDWLPEVAKVLASGSANDIRLANRIEALQLDPPGMETIADLEGCLLFGPKTKAPFAAKIGSLATKTTQPLLGPNLARLEDLARRVETGREKRLALKAARRTAILHAFAGHFLPEYASRKAARGLLDFDDLIARAQGLLTDPAVAQWVLFRLDGGIDHILVDEAQDTSPGQWRVIELLHAEFTAGKGARDRARTIFVVGDKKQSIYSFQGARVEAFDEKRALFSERLMAAQTPLQDRALLHSFRSSPTILKLVDQTFDERRGEGLGGEVKHIAFQDAMPGRVDLWPHIDPAEETKKAWDDPTDLVTDQHHNAVLGQRVAQAIKTALDAGVQIPGKHGPRAMQAGDVLVLVRKRSGVFPEVIRACKAAGLPIAGADRLKLAAELAVRDLGAVLAFLATPEDDLSLAAALRSPLFGLSEQALFTLAQGRKGYLWARLREATEHTDTTAILWDLLGQTDFLRPYDLIERILTRHDGRRRLIARLGDEAEDGIDELLSQALAFEANDTPSLTGFLGWLQTDDIDVKRQVDSAGQRIRVMTVHGAKGLEAPVVILPDTAAYTPQERGELLGHVHGPLWKTAVVESPEVITQARKAQRALEQAESSRLLYVAMTRAQSWLIVASAGKLGKDLDPEEDEAKLPPWRKQIESAMLAAGAMQTPDGGLCLSEGDWPAAKPAVSFPTETPLTPPHWAQTQAVPVARPARLLAPSKLPGAKALPGESMPVDAAMERGTLLHLLLEHLPAHDSAQWPALAQSLGAGSDLLEEARRVLSSPTLAYLFAPGTLAEVSVTADYLGQRLSGTIDRLVVTPGKVFAVDFKSNTVVPDRPEDTPEGLLRQLAAYDAALSQVYPGREISTAILWTRTAQLMHFDPEIVRGVTLGPTIT